MMRYTLDELRAWLDEHVIGGGSGSNKGSQMAQQQFNTANQQGTQLQNVNQALANQYNNQAQNYLQQADATYAPALAGGGGYTPAQIAQIEDQSGLAALPTAASTLETNYLTPQEQESILGNQSGINSGIGQVNASVAPLVGDTSTFTQNTRLTPAMQQQMVTAGARDAAAVDQSQIQHNNEAMMESGMDPSGMAGASMQANRQADIDEANAAANARVTASQVAAQREQGILGAEQGLSQAQMNAADTNLQAQQSMEANASQRAAGVAANRQGTNQANQATQFNQGQYVEGQGAGRAAGVADTQLQQQQNARNYLTGAAGLTSGAGLTAGGQTIGAFTGENTGANAATANQVQAQNKPAWWQSLLSAGAQVGGAVAGNPNGPVSDVRLKENIEPLVTLGGINLYRYNLIGDPTPRVGVMAQELHKTHPGAVVVGGDDPLKQPWRVRYDKISHELVAGLG